MNPIKLRSILKLYKDYFPEINKEEIYKWRAVKCFQDKWNIEAANFPEMVVNSLKDAKNLLDSGLYYPKRMLINNIYKDPETIRTLFKYLYNEEIDLIERLNKFRTKFRALNDHNFPGKQYFQDDRAVMVYLTLKYPERYFFYKYRMFAQFATLIDYPFKPQMGKTETVLQYDTLCRLIKSEIERDSELLNLHAQRLSDTEYHDINYHILTQDIIYAAVRHLDKFKQSGEQSSVSIRLKEQQVEVRPDITNIVLEGKFLNYVEIAKENKRIGDLGELLVIEYEREKLKRWNIKKEVIHSSKRNGDGLGYDIQSFNQQSQPIFIEVKTTKGSYTTPFYITANELEMSRQYPERYYLYRLYHYDDTNYSASFYSINGSLEHVCVNPVVYKVAMA